MTTKFLLTEDELPSHWYNILADVPEPLGAFLSPRTLEPLTPPDLTPIFPMAIIGQEVSAERWIEIPDRVRDIYKMWRPTPLHRATRLEKALDTPARIFYKYEGTSPAGSHKPNTAVAQAYYNAEEGIKRLTTETGAGQWGSALAFAGGLFGLEVMVYMVKVSYQQKPYRRALMETWGAKVLPSPTDQTEFGRSVLAREPESPGSLGIAISEAVEDAATRDDSHYSLGSVVNHVLLHQTVIGQEAQKQMEMADAYPDVVIGCVGGGSNFAGLAIPSSPIASQARATHDSSRQSPPRARRSRAVSTHTTSATPRGWDRWCRCTRLGTTSFPTPSTPVDSAITAMRRRFACSSRTASSKRAHTSRTSASRKRCVSRAARESCRRRNHRMHSGRLHRRPRQHARPVMSA